MRISDWSSDVCSSDLQFEFYEEPQYAESYRYRKGNSLNQNYGYIAERLFVDDQEALNSPKQNFGEYGGGDIKYLDVNRDGQITSADRVPLGHPTVPEIVYGFGFSAGYRSEEHTSELQSLMRISYAVFCLKKKNKEREKINYCKKIYN